MEARLFVAIVKIRISRAECQIYLSIPEAEVSSAQAKDSEKIVKTASGQMLGRSARENRRNGTTTRVGQRGLRRSPDSPFWPGRQQAARTRASTRSCRRSPGLPSFRCGSPQQDARNNRWNGCRGECGTKVLATIAVVSCGSFEPCGPQPPPGGGPQISGCRRACLAGCARNYDISCKPHCHKPCGRLG